MNLTIFPNKFINSPPSFLVSPNVFLSRPRRVTKHSESTTKRYICRHPGMSILVGTVQTKKRHLYTKEGRSRCWMDYRLRSFHRSASSFGSSLRLNVGSDSFFLSVVLSNREREEKSEGVDWGSDWFLSPALCAAAIRSRVARVRIGPSGSSERGSEVVSAGDSFPKNPKRRLLNCLPISIMSPVLPGIRSRSSLSL